jgi:glycine/D-amino acid oxidase-like deaminating enzyme
MIEHACDVVVCGGGIAGLWTMHALKAKGYHPILLETNSLGGSQTLAAQGILHGGLKYALDGKVDDIALRLKEMPARWLESMAGRGELDLTGTRVLSECQYLWSDGSLLSRISGALGSKMMQGEVDTLDRKEWPDAFRALDYRGSVRVLQETIIDVKSAVQALAKPLQSELYHVPSWKLHVHEGHVSALETQDKDGNPVLLKARQFIFTAGTGNELAAAGLELPPPATQRRPLRQILVKGVPYTLYGHCVIADPKPRVTVTTHELEDGTRVWYLGGNVAEKSCKHATEAESIRFAISELNAIFPKVPWDQFEYAVWNVDRAEPHQSIRFMPSEPAVVRQGNALVAWPTKLVFAPGLATKICHEVSEVLPPLATANTSLPFSPAIVGKYPWEQVTWLKPSAL